MISNVLDVVANYVRNALVINKALIHFGQSRAVNQHSRRLIPNRSFLFNCGTDLFVVLLNSSLYGMTISIYRQNPRVGLRTRQCWSNTYLASPAIIVEKTLLALE